jgi:hypothetical protein
VVVHSALPPKLTAAVDGVLLTAGVDHVAHGVRDPVAAGVAAAEDSAAVAFIGPVRSRAVAETVEATAPAGLPLIAPVATWSGVTRDDEPGCEGDPADHRGTVFRLLARDTEVAARIAEDVRVQGSRAFVVAGVHEYGTQLDGQLRIAGLPRTSDAQDADLLVLCALAGEPEIERARSHAALPVIAFDGVQGADLDDEREISVALPFAPSSEESPDDLFAGVGRAARAAELVVDALAAGAVDRHSVLTGLRAIGSFDEHGDPIDPDVWLWRRQAGWRLEPDRALARSGTVGKT